MRFGPHLSLRCGPFHARRAAVALAGAGIALKRRRSNA